jgi:hypothetical protein
MTIVGYYTGEALICADCLDYFRDEATRDNDTETLTHLSTFEGWDSEALPDGFTCVECCEVTA